MLEKEYIQVNKNAYNLFANQHADRHNKIGKYDLTDEDWVNLPQNRKDYYLEEYNLTNDNFKKILKTLRYLFQDENRNKYI